MHQSQLQLRHPKVKRRYEADTLLVPQLWKHARTATSSINMLAKPATEAEAANQEVADRAG